jgi:endogenous inhibitor of DNA gyrase (YacG/DUF329 family)
MADADNDQPPDGGAAPRKPCPICSKPSLEKYKPFCSKRCADVDLAKWLGGRYAIPAAENEDEDAEEMPPPRRDH